MHPYEIRRYKFILSTYILKLLFSFALSRIHVDNFVKFLLVVVTKRPQCINKIR